MADDSNTPQSPMITIEREKLDFLLTEFEESKKERDVLKRSATKIMDMFGLIDKESGKMKPEIASGEESFVPGMIKSLGDIVLLLTKSNAGSWFGGNKAKEELEKKFDFIQELLPIINKHTS